MTNFDYDLFVIGAGSGGVRAARIAAGHGARVGIAEEYRVGGTCVIRGCVPKKLLVYGADYGAALDDAAGFGWAGIDKALHWPRLRDAVQAEVTRLNGLYRQTLDKAGVTLFKARATFVDAHTLTVGDERIRARHILIATGGWPVMPQVPGGDLALTSNEAFHLEALPQRLLILGGGYIATEFAGIFNGLGVDVHLLYRGDALLRGWDADLCQGLEAIYEQRGIMLHKQTTFTKIERDGSGVAVTLGDGTLWRGDAVMQALGRAPNTGTLGLEQAGVAVTPGGAVVVDGDNRTAQPHIYAVGDVTDRVALTPVAIKEGHSVADRLFGGRDWRMDYDHIPSAVFSTPPLASVGLSEQAARAQGHEVRLFRSQFTPMRNTLAGRAEKSLCKLVVDAATDRVLGAHMLGPDSPEIIQGLAIALKAGATKALFDETIALHPSAAEEFVLMRS